MSRARHELARPACPRTACLSIAVALAALAAPALPACEDAAAIPFGVDVSGSDGGVAVGDFTVRTTADVAKLAGVRRIEGDLAITMRTATSLPDLESIGGSLTLVGTHEAEVTPDLDLPALTSIGGDLMVAYTKDAGTLDLPALLEVGGHVALTHGTWLADLRALTRIGGDLRVNDAGLDGLDLRALQAVGGSVRVLRYGTSREGGVRLALPALATVEGDLELAQGADIVVTAPKLAAIGRDLDVAGVRASLDLRGLATIGDDLLLEDVTLDALDLSALATVAGGVRIDGGNGDGLVAFELPALATVVGDLELRRVSSMSTASLPALVDLGGALVLAEDPALAELQLATLAETRGDIRVSEAGNVLVLALALTRIGGDFRLGDCGRMQASLPKLEEVVGSLVVSGGTLADLAAPKLASVGRDLVLDTLTIETDRLDLAALTAVGGTLRVARTLFLDVFAAARLKTIGSVQGGYPTGDLVVSDNFELATLDLGVLTSVQRDLVVRGNPRLRAEDLAALLADVVVGGTSTTCGNDGDAACPPE